MRFAELLHQISRLVDAIDQAALDDDEKTALIIVGVELFNRAREARLAFGGGGDRHGRRP